MAIIIGVDLATSTGLARLDSGTLTGTGLINIGKTDPDIDVASIAAFCSGADLVVIENVYCGANVKTAIDLAVLRGRLVQCLDMARINWTLCAPSTWRKTTICPPPKLKRKALKELSVAWVLDRYGMVVGNDIADAVCLAHWGAASCQVALKHPTAP